LHCLKIESQRQKIQPHTTDELLTVIHNPRKTIFGLFFVGCGPDYGLAGIWTFDFRFADCCASLGDWGQSQQPLIAEERRD
jgi:hypothetical protein